MRLNIIIGTLTTLLVLLTLSTWALEETFEPYFSPYIECIVEYDDATVFIFLQTNASGNYLTGEVMCLVEFKKGVAQEIADQAAKRLRPIIQKLLMRAYISCKDSLEKRGQLPDTINFFINPAKKIKEDQIIGEAVQELPLDRKIYRITYYYLNLSDYQDLPFEEE